MLENTFAYLRAILNQYYKHVNELLNKLFRKPPGNIIKGLLGKLVNMLLNIFNTLLDKLLKKLLSELLNKLLDTPG